MEVGLAVVVVVVIVVVAAVAACMVIQISAHDCGWDHCDVGEIGESAMWLG